MRMCGHAHHDDMLYLGKDPQPSWDYPPLHNDGYANRELYDFWAKRDPLPRYAAKLEAEGVISHAELDRMKKWAHELVEQEAKAVIAMPWPKPETAGLGVFAEEASRTRIELLEPERRLAQSLVGGAALARSGAPVRQEGHTFLEAVMLGVGDALRADPRVFVYGEDVGGQYGNAFLLLRPLLKEFGDRLINSPLAESAVLGSASGRRSRGSVRSARCSSTTSSRPASISS